MHAPASMSVEPTGTHGSCPREFRVGYPLSMMMIHASVAVMNGVLFGVALNRAVAVSRDIAASEIPIIPVLRNGMWLVVVFAVLALALLAGTALFFLFRIVQNNLAARRGVACIDQDGIAVTDWRGGKEYIPWVTIDEVRVPRLRVLLPHFPVAFRADGKWTGISPWVDDLRTVTEEVIQRASLAHSRHGWLQTRHTKSGPISGPR